MEEIKNMSINTLIISLLITFFLYVPLQKFLVDIYRQYFFDLRTELLINYEKSEEIDLMRNLINSHIFVLQKISIWRLFAFNNFTRQADSEIPELLNKIKAHEKGEELMHILNKMSVATVIFITLRSPALLIFSIPFILYKSLVFWMQDYTKKIEHYQNKLISVTQILST